MKNNIPTMFLTMLIAFLGGGLADIFNLSGAYLIGSMVFIFFSGLLKIKLFLPKFFRNLALGFAGLTIGHSITNETLNLLHCKCMHVTASKVATVFKLQISILF